MRIENNKQLSLALPAVGDVYVCTLEPAGIWLRPADARLDWRGVAVANLEMASPAAPAPTITHCEVIQRLL